VGAISITNCELYSKFGFNFIKLVCNSLWSWRAVKRGVTLQNFDGLTNSSSVELIDVAHAQSQLQVELLELLPRSVSG